MNTSKHGNVSAPVETYYDDWRTHEGLLVPYVITISSGKQTMLLTVTEKISRDCGFRPGPDTSRGQSA